MNSHSPVLPRFFKKCPKPEMTDFSIYACCHTVQRALHLLFRFDKFGNFAERHYPFITHPTVEYFTFFDPAISAISTFLPLAMISNYSILLIKMLK